jgi:hypothetical protein
MNWFFVPLFFLLCLLIFPQSCLAFQAKVAIIIDDIGYRKSDMAVLSLPEAITYAVLPHTPFGKTIAQQAFINKHDVLLHIPMQAQSNKKLGPGALTSGMDDNVIRQVLAKSFAEIPFALGINNHMGSYLTQLYSPMASVMHYLKDNDRIFIDSMTSNQSKAIPIAQAIGVPSLSRNVFLDNQLSQAYITKQFKQLIAQAHLHQYAIGIAHPHPETIDALTQLIPLLAANNIELVSISSLLPNQKKQYTDAP